MAKKSPAVTTDPTQSIIEQINKQFGLGVAVSAESILDEKIRIIQWSPALDVPLSGGVPTGSWVSISGPPKAGKSTAALTLAAEAQKEENGNMHVFYFDVEGRLKLKNLKGIKGLKHDPEHMTVFRSTKEKILGGTDFLRIASIVLKTKPNSFLIVDSVSALAENREMAEGVGTQTRGAGAQMLSQFCRTEATVVPVMKSIVVGITHLISNTSGFGSPVVERAANAWLYQSDVRIRIRKVTPWKVGADAEGNGGVQVGQKIDWWVQESALGPPHLCCEGHLRYGVGLDRDYEAIQLAMAVGLIDKSGSWFTLSFMEKHLDLLGCEVWDEAAIKQCHAQGADKLHKLLVKHPLWMATMLEHLKSMTAAAPEDDGVNEEDE